MKGEELSQQLGLLKSTEGGLPRSETLPVPLVISATQQDFSDRLLVPNLSSDELVRQGITRLIGLDAGKSRTKMNLGAKYGHTPEQLALDERQELTNRVIAACEKFPGFIDLSEDKKEAWRRDPSSFRTTMLSSFYFSTSINPDGSLPLPRSRPFLGYFDASDEDFARSEQVVGAYAAESIPAILEELSKLGKEQKKVGSIVAAYEANRQPSPQDVLGTRDLEEGGSITEPILQLGTPQEGLTNLVNELASPLHIAIAVPYEKLQSLLQVELADQSLKSMKIGIASPVLLRQGRQLAESYFRFISDNCLLDPSIRRVLNDKNIRVEERDAAISRYIDIECAHKSQALQIATEIQRLLVAKAEYLRSLIDQFRQQS